MSVKSCDMDFNFVIFHFSDVNECLTGDVCKNGGTCFNLIGSYYCQCPPGFEGETCEKGKDWITSPVAMDSSVTNKHPRTVALFGFSQWYHW